MNYSSRFFLYAPLGLFLAIACAVGLHWWVAASALSARLEATNGREIAPGVTMHFASRSITGFPFSLDTEFRDATFTVAMPRDRIEWRAERFAMHSLTYGRDETIFEAAGPQVMSWTRPDGTRPTVPFAVGSLHASAILKDGALARFDLDVLGFGSKSFTAQRLQFHVRRSGGDALEYLALAEAPRTPAINCPAPKGAEKIESIGTITHASALTPLLSGKEGWPASLAHWRASGGGAGNGTSAALSAEDLLTVDGLVRAVCGQPD